MAEECVFDICVVGAGIVGSCAAYNALKYTKSVVLCEQFPLGHSRGSSHGHSRIIRKSYIQEHYARMMPEAYKIWHELEQLSGEELLLNTGLLTLEDSPHENILKMKRHLEGINADFKYLDRDGLKQKFPMLQHLGTYNAVYEPTGGILRADKCCAVLQALFKKNGGTTKECFKVTKVIPGSVVTIASNESVIKAKSVIFTAGPWTNDILNPLGVHLPLQTMKINVCYWKAPDSVYSLKSGFPCFIDYTVKDGDNWHLYGLPNFEFPGLLKVCAHYGKVYHPDQRDAENDNKEVQVVAGYLKMFFKGVDSKPSIVDKCYYSWTPDEDFILDQHPVHKNIIFGAGFSGRTFTCIPFKRKSSSARHSMTKSWYCHCGYE
eukprot:gene15146-6334_t